MKTNRFFPPCAGLAAAFFMAAALAAPVQASKTWKGTTDANWATTTNWAEGAIPGTGDTVIFDSNSTANLTIATGASRTIRGLSVGSPSGAVTINSNTLTFVDRGIDMSAATQNLTVGSAITIQSAMHQWKVASGLTLTTPVPARNGGANNDTIGGHIVTSTTGTIKMGTAALGVVADGGGNPFVTIGTEDWAATDATGTIIAATYTADAWTGNASINTAGTYTTNNTTVNSVRFNNTGGAVTVNNSNTSTYRGILMTSGAQAVTITGGFIRPNRSSTAGASFSFIQNSTTADLTVGSSLPTASSTTPWALIKGGAGRMIFTGGGGHNGRVFIHEGILQCGDGGTSGTIATTANVINNASLVFKRSDLLTVANVISGSGTVTQAGAGELDLTGASTFTGAVNVNAGSLGVTALNNLGGGTAINIDGGTIKFLAAIDPSVRAITIGAGGAGFDTNALSVTLANPIGNSGAGGLTKKGGGTLTLGGANTYGGNTTVNAGTLSVTNTTGSGTSTGSVTVASGATLGGTGTIAGAVTVQSGGILAAGASVGTLTVGSLTMDAGSRLNVEFGTGNDLVVVSGTDGLTLNGGSVYLYQAGGVLAFTTPGTYNLFQYTGTLGGSEANLTVGNPQAGFGYAFGNSGGYVTVTITVAGVVRDWITNGGGAWGDSANWNGAVPGGSGHTVRFNTALAAPASITLDSARTAGVLLFSSTTNGYTLQAGSAGTLDLDNGGSEASITVSVGSHTIEAPTTLTSNTAITIPNAADGLTLSGNLGGIASLAKTGAGSLWLLGNNSTFGGTVSLSGGTTTFGVTGLGIGSMLTLDGTTLVWGTSNTEDISGRTVTINAGGATLNTNGNNVTFANPVGGAGAGALTKSGTGALVLGGDNTYTGGTSISNGTLQIGAGGTAGSVSGNIVNNAALVIDRSDSVTLTNLISGTGTLAIGSSGGTVELNAANTFTGGTTIGTATLRLLNALALQNSTLDYNAASGTFEFGTLTAATLGGLTGDKSLALENATPAAVALTVGGNGASTTYSGILSGTGSLTKTGAGTLILNGAHTFTGATSASGGILEIDAGGSITTTASVSVNGGGRIDMNGGTLTTSGLTSVNNAGTVYAELGVRAGATATLNGGIDSLGQANYPYLIKVLGDGTPGGTGTLATTTIRLGRSALAWSTEPTAGSDTTGLYVNGGNVTLTGTLQLGTVSGANSSVSTRIDSGTLSVAGATTVGINNGTRWSVFDVNGGTFTCADTTTGLLLSSGFEGKNLFLVRSGSATVERIQFGQGALNGTGVVAVNGGALYVGSGGMVLGTTGTGYVPTVRLVAGLLGAKAAWSSDLPVTVSGTAFTIKCANDSGTPYNITLTGALSGSATLSKQGGGVLRLNGASTAFTGTLDVQAGTVAGIGTLGGTITSVAGTEIAPGNPGSGLLTAQSATIAGSLRVDIDGTAHDRFVTTGALDITNATLDIDLGTGGATQPAYIIASYGSLTGAAFAGVVDLPTGYTIDYAYNDGASTHNIALVSGTPYTNWAGSYGLTGASAAADADPDNDGIDNAIEFVIGGNPTTATEAGKLPTLSRDATGITFVFRRSTVSVASNPGAVHNATLTGSWTPALDGVGGVTVTVDPNPDFYAPGIGKVTVFIPTTDPAHFARLTVTISP